MDDRRDVCDCETATENKWGLGRGETQERGQSSERPLPTGKRLAGLGQGVAKGRVRATGRGQWRLARRMERPRGGEGFWTFWSGTEVLTPEWNVQESRVKKKKIKTENRSTGPVHRSTSLDRDRTEDRIWKRAGPWTGPIIHGPVQAGLRSDPGPDRAMNTPSEDRRTGQFWV